jgi:hypothetical protein
MQDYYSIYTWAMDKQARMEREAAERAAAAPPDTEAGESGGPAVALEEFAGATAGAETEVK